MTEKKNAWRARAEKELRGRPVDSLTWHTPEGIPVAPVYDTDDLDGLCTIYPAGQVTMGIAIGLVVAAAVQMVVYLRPQPMLAPEEAPA